MLPQAQRYAVFAPFLPITEKDHLYSFEEEQALQLIYQMTHSGIKTYGVSFLGEHTDRLVFQDHRVRVNVEGRTITCQIWEYLVYTANGNMNSIYFIDTDVPENRPEDRPLSRQLFTTTEEYTLQSGLYAMVATQTVLNLGTKNLDIALTFGNLTSILEPALHSHREYRKVQTYTFLLDEWSAQSQQIHLDGLRTMYPDLKIPTDFTQEETILCRDFRVATAERIYCGNSRIYAQVSEDFVSSTPKLSYHPILFPEFWLPDTAQHWLSSHLGEWQSFSPSEIDVFDISLRSVAHLLLTYKKSLREYVKSTQGIILEEDIITIGMSVHTLDEVYGTLLSEPSRLLSLAEKFDGIHLVVIYNPTIVTHQEQQREKDFQLFAERYYHSGVRFTLVKSPSHQVIEETMPGIDIWLTNPQLSAQSNSQVELAVLLYGIPFITGKNHPVLSREYHSFGWYLSEYSPHQMYDLLLNSALPEIATEKYVTRRRAGLSLSLKMFREEGDTLVSNILLND